jgi:hypothetical protein
VLNQLTRLSQHRTDVAGNGHLDGPLNTFWN